MFNKKQKQKLNLNIMKFTALILKIKEELKTIIIIKSVNKELKKINKKQKNVFNNVVSVTALKTINILLKMNKTLNKKSCKKIKKFK